MVGLGIMGIIVGIVFFFICLYNASLFAAIFIGGFFLFMGILCIASYKSIQNDYEKHERDIRTLSYKKNFNVTKEIGGYVEKLALDEVSKRWCIIKRRSVIYNVYDYSDIVDFELIENGEKYKIEGTLLRSVVGGVLFGAIGAVVGATTGKTVTTVDSMYINIYTKKGDVEKIQLLFATADKNDSFYKDLKGTAEKIMAILYAIKNDNN